MTNIALDINNPALAPLATRSYDKKYTPVPNSKLGTSLLSVLSSFYSLLTNKDLQGDDSTLTVKADNGRFQKIYGPSVYANKEGTGFVIQWGKEAIDLTPKKGGSFEEIDPEKLSIVFASVPYGQTLECVLRLMFFDETDEAYILDLSVWSASKDAPPAADSMNALLNRNPAKAIAQLAPQPEFSSFDGPQYSAGDLEEGDYAVVGYRQVATKWGVKYLMLCAPQPELNQPGPFELWSDKTSTPVLSLSPVITEEKPAELSVYGKRQTKKGTIAADTALSLPEGALPMSEGGLDLDF